MEVYIFLKKIIGRNHSSMLRSVVVDTARNTSVYMQDYSAFLLCCP